MENSKTPALTVYFLQKFVEENGGGGEIIWSGSAGADQLAYACSNGSYDEWRMTTINIRITAPAGGTWLIWGTPIIEFLLSGASSSYDGAVQYHIPYWPRTYTSTYKTRYPAGTNTETINVNSDIIIVPGGTNIFNQAVNVSAMTPEYTSTGGIKQWRVNYSNVACIKLA